MDQIFKDLFRQMVCLAIFTVVYSAAMQPSFISLSIFSQNNLEVAELYCEEGPQEEKQETETEEKKIDLNRSNITEYLFEYRTKLAIHNGRITVPKFISTVHIPPPERAGRVQ